MTNTTRRRARIAIDTKNFALYSGGIAAHFRPLLMAWIAARPQLDFVLVGPAFDAAGFQAFTNVVHHVTAWPTWLPRKARHPVYDNFIFPRAVRRVRPDAVMSPYHDVRLPTKITSVMMLHDTCIHDLAAIYPRLNRWYFLHMLRCNLRVAGGIVTVSAASLARIQSVYGDTGAKTYVVPSPIEPALSLTAESRAEALALRSERTPGLHIFYSGGAEYRKNVARLVQALQILREGGESAQLWTTGSADAGWTNALAAVSADTAAAVHFLGRIDLRELNRQYQAADVVAYPSLCEGFGRVVLEAMQLGVPVACSDIPVSREVAGDYPVYFNPQDPRAIATGLLDASRRPPKGPVIRRDYLPEVVADGFIAAMDDALASAGLQ